MIRFAIGNLLARRVRTLLALVGLAVAIAGVIGLISFAVGLRAMMETTADEVGGILVLEHEVVSPIFSRLDAATTESVRRVPGVRAVSREVMSPALTADGESTLGRGLQGPPIYLGIDPHERARLRGGGYFKLHLVEGEGLPPDDPGKMQISSSIAASYEKRVGDTFSIMHREFVVCGIHDVENTLLSQFVIIHIDQARGILKLEEGVSTALFVEAEDPAATRDLATRIQEQVEGVEARATADWADLYGDLSRRIDLFLAVIASFAVVVGAIGIANTMLMSVTERIGEFGVLRATGWSRRNVLGLVVTESLTLGLGGGILGIVLGILASQAITLAVPIEPVISLGLVGMALTLAAVTGTLGGIYPAWRAASMDVVTAIRFRDL